MEGARGTNGRDGKCKKKKKKKVGKPEGKRPLRRPRRRWENIRTDIRETM
jgi:hypothetical protein